MEKNELESYIEQRLSDQARLEYKAAHEEYCQIQETTKALSATATQVAQQRIEDFARGGMVTMIDRFMQEQKIKKRELQAHIVKQYYDPHFQGRYYAYAILFADQFDLQERDKCVSGLAKTSLSAGYKRVRDDYFPHCILEVDITLERVMMIPKIIITKKTVVTEFEESSEEIAKRIQGKGQASSGRYETDPWKKDTLLRNCFGVIERFVLPFAPPDWQNRIEIENERRITFPISSS
ncbi:TPA: hypothetical protein HA241_06060 [Candidatus Woesearchaeota archaeon]|nr:hypothetical protein [Candidatus Woesearchaeota archaeon]